MAAYTTDATTKTRAVKLDMTLETLAGGLLIAVMGPTAFFVLNAAPILRMLIEAYFERRSTRRSSSHPRRTLRQRSVVCK